MGTCRTLKAVALIALAATAACVPADDPDPTAAPQATVEIAPISGPGGTWVDLRAHGFPPRDSVALGLGPPRSEYEVVRGARTGPAGRVDALMQIPDWAADGDRYVFVVSTVNPERDLATRAVSEPFTIHGAGGGRGTVASVSGVLTATGAECPTLETAGGTIYSLAGPLDGFGAGERVTVFGTPAETSFCMLGVTLEVDSVVSAAGR